MPDASLHTYEDIRGHLEYLRTTLIPDLHDSGRHETASDFETDVSMIEQLLAQVTVIRAVSPDGTDFDAETMAKINDAQGRLDEVSRETAEAMRLYDRSDDGSQGKIEATRKLDELSARRLEIERELDELIG